MVECLRLSSIEFQSPLRTYVRTRKSRLLIRLLKLHNVKTFANTLVRMVCKIARPRAHFYVHSCAFENYPPFVCKTLTLHLSVFSLPERSRWDFFTFPSKKKSRKTECFINNYASFNCPNGERHDAFALIRPGRGGMPRQMQICRCNGQMRYCFDKRRLTVKYAPRAVPVVQWREGTKIKHIDNHL